MSLAPLSADFSLSRTEFLGLLTGEQRPHRPCVAEMMREIETSAATVTLSPGPDAASGSRRNAAAMLWVGQTHTTVMAGSDPVAVKRIKVDNTAFAVIGLLDMRRAGPPRADLRRWRILVDGPAPRRIELLDRSPGCMWEVIDTGDETRVRPTTLGRVVDALCDAIEPLLPPY